MSTPSSSSLPSSSSRRYPRCRLRCPCLPGPPHIGNVVAAEFAERFVFYGTRALLPLYLVNVLGFTEAGTVSAISLFSAGCYLSPLGAGILADSLWGRFTTIARFLCIYILGAACVAATSYGSDTVATVGLCCGLALIAIGTGGVKTSVAPFGADQLGGGQGVGAGGGAEGASDDELTSPSPSSSPSSSSSSSASSSMDSDTTTFFFAFYMTINLGSLLSYVLVPVLRQSAGYGPSFTLLFAALVLSLLIFISARKEYTRTPPVGSIIPRAYRVVRAAYARRRISAGAAALGAGAGGGGAGSEAGGAGAGAGDEKSRLAVEQQPLIPRSSPKVSSTAAAVVVAAAATAKFPPISSSSAATFERGGAVSGRAVDNKEGEESGEEEDASGDDDERATASTSAAGNGLTSDLDHSPTGTWLDGAVGVSPTADIVDVAAVLRLAPIFALLPVFWMVYDSYSALWTLQARKLDLCLSSSVCLQPENMQTLNPLLVVTLIPLFDRLVKLMMRCRVRWLRPTPLRRMAFGMFLTLLAWITCGLLEIAIERGKEQDGGGGSSQLSVGWQVPQYLILTIAEVCVSTTGVEFAYREAPPSAKGLVMAMWYLATTVGDLLNSAIYTSLGETLSSAELVWVSSGLMLVGAVAFSLAAWAYVPADRAKAEREARRRRTEGRGRR